ncbi:glutamate-5-semialdehyde dehydrogenase, partial [bacterium]|nr:glutamate-5-semialdehyde dehydrogenase [bacterium]
MSTDNLESHLLDVCTRARRAGYAVANLCADEKNAALRAMADLIVAEREFLETENQRDINAARDKGMSAALIDRLTLNVKRIKSMAEGLHAVAALDDPVGALLDQVTRPSGIEVTKVRVPIGVICMVYESRPNVTADAAGLCLKAGNAVILRGGSEAIHSNIAIARLLQRALVQTGIHQDAIQLVETTDRAAVDYLLKASKYIDLVIPRGGESLIRKVVETSRIPVLKHYDGVCHTYIAGSADKEKAVSVSLNAKAQRPGTCNAMETLLVDKAVAAEIIPPLFAKMREAGVELRGCEATRAIDPAVKPATEEDWRTE